GVPPMLLGIPGDATYNNYREANLAFWRQTALPLVAKTAQALTNWLRPRFGSTLRL
ncbi:MAG TPA: phage portal protein, partial [Alphaproteobacteria bacterium]|nr:phage portal protein [Alphaproteobacteria bacterium]